MKYSVSRCPNMVNTMPTTKSTNESVFVVSVVVSVVLVVLLFLVFNPIKAVTAVKKIIVDDVTDASIGSNISSSRGDFIIPITMIIMFIIMMIDDD